jgi:hypothetical protein
MPMYTNHQQSSRTLTGIFFYRVFKDVPADLYIYQLKGNYSSSTYTVLEIIAEYPSKKENWRL